MQNCRILSCGSDPRAVVVDPGGDVAEIEAVLKRNGLECREIWLTHSHLDHCGGVHVLKERTGARLFAHPLESEMRQRVKDLCLLYGLPHGSMEDCPEPEEYISGGETLLLGDLSFQVLFTPGHSPGHVCFYNQPSRTLLAGDTLFAGSIGRTDLPGGDHQTLLRSIRESILGLPSDTVVMPGHGPDTTIGIEKHKNPFLNPG